MDEREIDSHNRGPLPNALASESVTTAIDEAERQNRQRAIVLAGVAVVLSLLAAFVLVQIVSAGDDPVATTVATSADGASDGIEADVSSGSADFDQGGSTSTDETNEAVEITGGTDASLPTATTDDPSTIDVSGFATPESPLGNEAMTLRGMGAIDLGMSVTEAEAAIGGTIIEPSNIDAECVQTRIGGDSLSPVLMILGTGDFSSRTIVRIDMVSGNTTRSGIGIGSPSSEVHATYGENIQGVGELLAYVPNDVADADYRIVMDIVGDVVLEARNGLLPYVDWAGCQP